MGAALRIGIVGTGAMAAYHARRFASIEGCVVSACADRDPFRAASFAAAAGIPAFHGDAEAMICSGTIDAVSVASRDAWHCEPVLAALSRGLPCFCEKPMARSLAEAQTMADAALSSGIPALVNFSKRNGGVLSQARSLIGSGAIGRISGAEFSYLQGWLVHDRWGDWRTTPRWQWRIAEDSSTGGVVGDLGSHLLDAALLLLGEVVVSSCLAHRYPGELPFDRKREPAWESFQALLHAPGSHACVSGSFRARGCLDSFRCHVRGELADIAIDLERSRDSLLVYEGPDAKLSELKAPELPSSYERFVELAGGGVDPLPGEPIDFGRGLEVQALVAAAQALAQGAGAGASAAGCPGQGPDEGRPGEGGTRP